MDDGGDSFDGQLVDRVVVTIAPMFLQGYNVLDTGANAGDASTASGSGARERAATSLEMHGRLGVLYCWNPRSLLVGSHGIKPRRKRLFLMQVSFFSHFRPCPWRALSLRVPLREETAELFSR